MSLLQIQKYICSRNKLIHVSGCIEYNGSSGYIDALTHEHDRCGTQTSFSIIDVYFKRCKPA